MREDTIAAVSTPLGEGGIGIVRVSGRDAVAVAKKVFMPKKNRTWAEGPGFRLVYGFAIDPESGAVIDEVLLSFMRAPYSFTTEDVVEFNCHGGFVAVRKVLQAVIAAGARLAEPGEFTQRALLGGRIDLCQAEAVLDVIRAATEEGLRVAQGQLLGTLTREIQGLREATVSVLSAIEAGIDFPDDVPGMERAELLSRLQELKARGAALLENAAAGAVYRDGITMVLAGKANVGKSSLLNILAGKDKAIVTAWPGTTRDIIEEIVNVRGIPVRILDTAGIRDAVEEVEKIGVTRAREALSGAQLVVVVLDAASGITREDKAVFEASTGRERIVAVNKIDLAPAGISQTEIQALADSAPVIKLSALTGEGLESLRRAIADKVFHGRVYRPEEVLISRVRHRDAVKRYVSGITSAIRGLTAGMPDDLISLDVRSAAAALGEITGETVAEDVIEGIFREFCVGK